MADIDIDASTEELADGDGKLGVPKIEVTRTELVWPGKYDENGQRREVERVTLPFQVIERVNESRATREARAERGLTLFDVWKGDEGETFEDGWRNKLIWGDNKLVMASLLEHLAGKVDLIYIDPPFATGADFSFIAEIGEDSTELFKEQSVIEEKAYRDTWARGLESYLEMVVDRLGLMRELLSPRGQIYVHVGWQVSHYVRALLDEVFGKDRFLNEVVWHYQTSSGSPKTWLHRNHDLIFRYAKGDPEGVIWHHPKSPWPEATLRKWQRDEEGRIYRVQNKFGKRYYIDPEGKLDDDVIELTLSSRTYERTGFPTQKPLALLERIVESSSDPGSIVADFFVGSGTAAVAAERLGRRWIACDLGRYGVHVSRKRLLDTEDCRPFEVLNLGKYERRYWQVATFGEDLDEDGVISLYEYVAFILKLYGATPASGLEHLHGKLGTAFIHVGAVDAPVTIDEVAACVEECVALKAGELHVLGWEWEMGMNDLVSAEAKRRGVKVVLRQIPREVMEEQAAAKGDVQFFELAYLEARVEPSRNKREFMVQLENFVIPNPELVPDDVREKITKWSDYVDYWAVDWDFRDDTFMQGWVTYRTRRDRKLELRSVLHAYDESGEYAVMVKVVDVFGNDSSTIIRLKVD